MLQIFRGKCPQPTQTRIKLLVEYENKNCNNIFSENLKGLKKQNSKSIYV